MGTMLTKEQEQMLAQSLADPNWRLRRLYYITNKEGEKILFKPNASQLDLLARFHFRNIILKARQLGFSTLIQILMLDTALFNPHFRGAVIAHDQDSATKIFRDKIKFAYDNLPDAIKAWNPVQQDNQSMLMLSNDSSVEVATSARSGTIHILHISEYGRMCAKYPLKAHEVQTGSLPAVPTNGIAFIESTAEGQEGSFYDMVQIAMAKDQAGKTLSQADYKFFFYPWWDNPEYDIEPDHVVITERDHRYFAELEAKIGRTLRLGQKAWYVAKRESDFAGDEQKMWQEYPSTPEEAFQVSLEGAYYTEQLARARRDGRITKVPYQDGVPVNTFWDIGANDDTAIWFHQRVGIQDRWIRYYEASGQPFNHFARYMQQTGYVFGHHYGPHDIEHKRQLGQAIKTPREMMEELGIRPLVTVPRIPLVQTGIQQVRENFASCWFDEELTAPGVKHLGAYRKQFNDQLQVFREEPRHDQHSNGADAFRQWAQAKAGGIILEATPTWSRDHYDWRVS